MAESIDLKTARATLSDLAARASNGEEFILTRYGRGVAYLGPIPDPDPRLGIGYVDVTHHDEAGTTVIDEAKLVSTSMHDSSQVQVTHQIGASNAASPRRGTSAASGQATGSAPTTYSTQMDVPFAASPTIRPEGDVEPIKTWAQRNAKQAARDEFLHKIPSKRTDR